MRFDELASYFERLQESRGRAKMYELLGELFTRARPGEVAEVAYLCEARLGPPFAAVNIGMGERMVAAAIQAATGRTEEQIDKLYAKLGDLGLVVQRLLPKSRQSTMSISKVYSTLLDIARTSGSKSGEKKIERLATLIKSASPHAALYMVRFVLGRLRLGVGAPTIIEAVARTQPDSREARAVIDRAYNLCSDLGLVLETLRRDGIGAVRKFKVRLGNPVRMMMAERLPDAGAIIERLGECAAEAKLDGLRCQLHLGARTAEIFSRNLERTTAMFPDIIAAARRGVTARNAIIEGEAIAFDESTGEFHPFQVTVQRKRKHKIEEMAHDFPLVFIAFDLLYANGKDLTNSDYQTRRAALEKLITTSTRLRTVDRVVTGSEEELQKFFDEEIGEGMEGIIAKRLDSQYEAGARNYNWIKLKRTYHSKLNDTIDVAIVGYLRGRGMRARLGIGAFLAAVYDADTDSFKTVGKVGSGLSEKNWIRLREMLDEVAVDDRPARVDSRTRPDRWVEPRYVITILADEITRSPVNTAALDENGTGLSLRFPRVVDFIREDKSAEDATTVDEIRKMYRMQRKQKK
jgi:DNA ligase-1